MGKVLPNNNNNLWIDILFTWRVKNNGIENIQRVKTVRNITRGKKAIKFTSEWVVKGAFGVLSKPKNIYYTPVHYFYSLDELGRHNTKADMLHTWCYAVRGTEKILFNLWCLQEKTYLWPFPCFSFRNAYGLHNKILL